MPSSPHDHVDVCVYGGTSGGVIAAVALAKLGRSVLLIEQTNHVGGMTSGGLGWIDYKYAEWPVGGLARQWLEELKAAYREQGIEPNDYYNAGWVCEPHMAENLFDRWLERHHITVVRGARLRAIETSGRRVTAITLDRAPPDPRGAPPALAEEPGFLTVKAPMFLDCSYEGDLLAAAGVTCRCDREGRSEYGEQAAGIRYKDLELGGGAGIDPYVRPGDPSSGLIPMVSDAPAAPEGSASPLLQAYNFRLCLVKDNPIPIEPPDNYDPGQFELLARLLEAHKANGDPIEARQFHHPPERLLKMSRLPRGKTDVNNGGLVSMDFVGAHSERYAAMSWAERQSFWHAHEDYQKGMLYFLQTDPRVDEEIRKDLLQWGLPRDEFRDTGGWPFQLYIREARRMVGQRVMRSADCTNPPAHLPSSVGLGVYSCDSHHCQRVVRNGRVVTEGGMMVRLDGPYPIPYEVITPRAEECENILATFCVSASHASFSSLRMEPQLMVLSESAAHAVHLALSENRSVQDISLSRLRDALLDAGQILDPAEP